MTTEQPASTRRTSSSWTRADECLGHRPAIGVCARRDDATRERVRAWDRRLQHGAWRCELTEPLELLDDAEAARGAELADDAVAPTLVVRGRTEAPPWSLLELEPVEVRVERQVEVEPGLLAVGDHVEPGAHLIRDGRGDRVSHRLFAIVGAEFVGM